MKKLSFIFPSWIAVLLLIVANNACAQPRLTPNWGENSNFTDPNSLLEEAKEGQWLVRARCLSVSNVKETDKRSRWRIEYVFNGPKTLENQLFEAYHQSGNFGGSQPPFVPDVNEDALWAVKFDGKQAWNAQSSVWMQTRRNSYGIFQAVGENHFVEAKGSQGFPTFAQALSHAQFVERVAKAKRQEQIRLLKVYARSSLPSGSAWAIATLAEHPDESSLEFLLHLVDAPLPVAGMLALDMNLEALDEQGKTKWNDTPARFNLWHHLVTAPLKGADGNSISERLAFLSQAEAKSRNDATKTLKVYVAPIGGERLFKWLRLATNNETWAVDERAHAISRVGLLGKSDQISRLSAWKFLLTAVESHPDFAGEGVAGETTEAHALHIELARGALIGMQDLKPFTLEESAALQALQRRAKSSRLKFQFEITLSPS